MFAQFQWILATFLNEIYQKILIFVLSSTIFHDESFILVQNMSSQIKLNENFEILYYKIISFCCTVLIVYKVFQTNEIECSAHVILCNE